MSRGGSAKYGRTSRAQPPHTGSSHPDAPRLRRCAIYTRKSSEEGLEQSFNSLHAQREAGEAYVRSQAHEGWTALPALYDDGGFSGGTMDRPALQRLLADIERGLIDVVVVYKVDRLTRALGDFARIVEAFDARGVSFVSVTQAFNTTTSMGRLTLNVLLSFAQFEREVTGERIRDKIALSKQRGMWMGGAPPLAYDPAEGTLTVNRAEAEQLKAIYRRYLEVGSVHRLRDELEEMGVRSKAWTTRSGRAMGGQVISRGALYHLLQNRTYRGEIVHRDKVYPGRHTAIVEPELFERVQRQLAANRRRFSGADRPSLPSHLVLAGKLFDAEGDPMSPTVSYGRTGRRYRYYVSSCLQIGVAAADAPSLAPRRLPAVALEQYVLATIRRLSGRQDASEPIIGALLRRLDVRAASVELVLDSRAVFGRDHPELALSALQRRLGPDEEAVKEFGDEASLRVRLPVRLQFRGGRRGLVQQSTAFVRSDPILIKALRTAHKTLKAWKASPLSGGYEEARSGGTSYDRKLVRLAFLAPDLQEAILDGHQPSGLTWTRLKGSDIPLDWAAQRRWWRSL